MRRHGSVLLLLAALGCDGSPAPAAAAPAASAPAAEATAEPTTPPVTAKAASPTTTPDTTIDPNDPCAGAAFALPASTIVATVDGEPVRASALGEDATDAEREARHGYCREVHRIRTSATQRAVDDHLLSAAARKKGVAVDAFVREHLASAVVEPDEAEIAAFYEANKTDKAPPLEMVRGQVQEAIVKERSKGAYDALLASLRKGTTVATTLPEVRPPAFDFGTSEHTATFGPADATVSLVEFSDFECPYCSRAADAVTAVKKRFGDRIRFSYRHFPLNFHPAAQPAAEMTQCANEQGKFWALHDEIFAGQRAGLSPEGLRTMAQQVGVDMAAMDECLASGRARDQVQKDMTQAREVGVRGTPSFYINGRAYDGGVSPDELVAAIEQQLRG